MKTSGNKLQKRTKRKNKCKRLLSGILCAALTITAFSGSYFAQPKQAEAKEATLSDPRIVPDSSMKAGQKVTWDCVWFGSYPQAEVVPSSEAYTALDKKLLQKGDLIVNHMLYLTLQGATGWDERGDIVIGNEKYKRIKKDDATYSSTSTSYYNWKNATDYHYFKYQPIKWRVLSVDGSEAMLLADRALDDKQYQTVAENITWDGCTMRSWLNGYSASANIQNQDYSSNNFLDTAFGISAQSVIKETVVENKDNLSSGTDGGNDTRDKVFLLSESEVYTDVAKKHGFVSNNIIYDEARRAKSSVFAKAMGIWSNISDDYVGNCWWWLRSPGATSAYATNGDDGGRVLRSYNHVNTTHPGMRPALNLNLNASSDALSSNLWSYAGTVCSDGTVEESGGVGGDSVDTSIDEDEFIKQHIDFIEKDNKYDHLLEYCDLSRIALRDYSELKDTYDIWRAVRKKLFDNPYETFLADMIINESSAEGQIKNFNLNLYSTQRSIINNVMKLIEGKVSLSKDDKNKIQKLFMTKDFSDTATYQLCQELLGNKFSYGELQAVFQVYDTSNKFMSLLGDGKKIVDSVIDVINYSSILQAYYNTSDEFQIVLMQMEFLCHDENSELDYAITQYLNVEKQYDIRDSIIKKVVGNTLEVGNDIFKDAITKKVGNFLIENMDLSEVGTAAAAKILSFIEGMKIGYSIGTTIDNILFNTDKVTDSYITAYASAKAGYYLRLVLDDNSANLRKDHSLKNAKLFCETFNMYKWVQEDVANKMIQYFSSNQQSLIDKIFKHSKYEVSIYQWQIMKLSWNNVHCREGALANPKMKCITIACPVKVTITDVNGNLVLKMQDDVIDYCSTDAVVCIRNGIKYITVPDADYNIDIVATAEGTMAYSIGTYDNFMDLVKTVNYEDIKLIKDMVYTGRIVEGETFTEQDTALISNGEAVDCDSTMFKEKEKINIDKVVLSQEQLTMVVNEGYTLKADITPQNASIKTLTWYSENPDIATVNEYGVVIAKSVGETSIICMTLDGEHVQKCKLNVTKKSDEVLPDDSPSPTPTSKPPVRPNYPYVPSVPNTPVVTPTASPSAVPTLSPAPTVSPTVKSTTVPTTVPTVAPTPVLIETPEPTLKPTETPKATIKPSAKPKPSARPGKKDKDKTNSAKKIKKGSKVTDKKTKAVYKITGTGKNRTAEYTKSTRKNPSSISIPASIKLNGKNYKVTSVGKAAFKNSKKLKTVKLGKNVKKIGQQAFYGCTKLTNVSLGKNVTSIGANAFNKCTALTIITIPSKVNKIGAKAFYQCRKLRYFMVKTKKLTLENIGENAFGRGYGSPRVKTDKGIWKRYSNVFLLRGMSKKALFVIDPVKLVI